MAVNKFGLSSVTVKVSFLSFLTCLNIYMVYKVSSSHRPIVFVAPEVMRGINYAHNIADLDNFLWTDDSQSCFNTKHASVGDIFLSRLKRFNEAIDNIRSLTLVGRGSHPWNDSLFLRNDTLLVVIRETDDVVQRLSGYRGLRTAVLRWVVTKVNNSLSWSSLDDNSNLLVQKYYSWTGDVGLCAYVHENVSEKMEKCTNISTTSYYTSLEPELFHWNRGVSNVTRRDGDSNVVHFMGTPFVATPVSMQYLHIFTDTIITDLGYVVNGQFKYVTNGCLANYSSESPLQLLSRVSRTVYGEVFVISQNYGNAVFHRMIDAVPRLAPFIDFLRLNRHIKIHGYDIGGRLDELLTILGIDGS